MIFVNCFYLLHNKTNKFLGIYQNNIILTEKENATDFDYKQIGNYYAIYSDNLAFQREGNSILAKNITFNKNQAFNFKIDENLNLFLLDSNSCYNYTDKFIKVKCTNETDTFSLYFLTHYKRNSL